MRLGVNIDHVATLRNVRGGIYPSPIDAAIECEKAGANLITIHLREDRRHIRNSDIEAILSAVKIPINLEIAPTEEMVAIAIREKLPRICFVPENRKELTTEGGFDVKRNQAMLNEFTKELQNNGVDVAIFVEPDIEQISASAEIGIGTIEIHTGNWANTESQKELERIMFAAKFCERNNINCHAGHGLNYNNMVDIIKIPQIIELNIGHFIISDAIFRGLSESVRKMLEIIKINRNVGK